MTLVQRQPGRPGDQVNGMPFWACRDQDGVLLVRPDKHIDWRSMTLPRGPEQALTQILSR